MPAQRRPSTEQRRPSTEQRRPSTEQSRPSTEQRQPSTDQRRLSTEQRRVLLPNGRDVTDSVHDLDPGTAVLLLLGNTAKLYAIWDGDRFSKMPEKQKGILSHCKPSYTYHHVSPTKTLFSVFD